MIKNEKEINYKNEDKKENLINKPKNLIIINKDYFELINGFMPLIIEIMNDLNNNLINENLFLKIRFFNILFESYISNNYESACDDFLKHFFNENSLLKEKDARDLISKKSAIDKINGKKKKYKFQNNILSQESVKGIIQFNIKEYHEIIKDNILHNNEILKFGWENNNIKSFQAHNFLLKEDIIFVKNTLKKIYKSKLWEEILSIYCDNDFISDDYFKNDCFIEQILNKIIFFPFNINNLGLFAFTSSYDLNIYVSGYPFIEGACSLENYILYRILQMAALIIVIYTKQYISIKDYYIMLHVG